MARTASTENLMSISGSVPVELHAALEDTRWGRRLTMSQMVRTGLEYWAKAEGIWTDEKPADEAQDGVKDDEAKDEAKDDEAKDEAKDDEPKDEAKDDESDKAPKTTSRTRK